MTMLKRSAPIKTSAFPRGKEEYAVLRLVEREDRRFLIEKNEYLSIITYFHSLLQEGHWFGILCVPRWSADE
jgi:hypothetical protein